MEESEFFEALAFVSGRKREDLKSESLLADLELDSLAMLSLEAQLDLRGARLNAIAVNNDTTVQQLFEAIEPKNGQNDH